MPEARSMSRISTRYWYSTLLGMGAILALSGPVQAGWKAGAARGAITPKEPMWMAGYAARNHPSEGAAARPLGQGPGGSRSGRQEGEC